MRKISKVFSLIIFAMLCIVFNVKAQKILNVKANVNSVCAPGTLNILFNTDGKMPTGSKFIAVLSDENGVFNATKPNVIGVNLNSPISVSFSDTLIPSNKYLVTVICASPMVFGDTSSVINVKTTYIGFNNTIAAIHDTICQGSYTKIESKLSPTFPNVSYKWYVNGVLISGNSQSSLVTAGISGTNTNFLVHCIATVSNGCIKNNANDSTKTSNKDSIIVLPTLNQQIKVSASADSICEGSVVTLNSKVVKGTSGTTFKWYYTLLNDTAVHVLGSSAKTTTNLIPAGATVFLEATNSEICIINNVVTETLKLAVEKYSKTPPAIVISTETALCEGSEKSGVFRATPFISNGKYTWFIDNVALPTQSIQNELKLSKSSVINGQVITCQLKLNSKCVDNNLSISNSIKVNILPDPIYTLSDTVKIIYGQPDTIRFSGDILPSTMNWSGYGNNTIRNGKSMKTVVVPIESKEFTIDALSTNFCPIRDVVYVKVLPNKESFFLPNAFSPNGDLKNDVYYCRSVDNQVLPSSFLMEIFDENGTMVFESKYQNYGWDGNYKSLPCEQGIYTYHVKGTFFNFETFDFKDKFLLIR